MTQNEANQLIELISGMVDGKSTEESSMHCNEHGVPMVKKWSEKKQKNYWIHRNEEGQACFGKGYLTS